MSFATAAFLSLALCVTPDQADDDYQFIVGLCDKKMYELAASEAESFLRKHPRHARADHARYRLATAQFELGQFEQAVPHLQKLLSAPGFEFEAEVAFRLGQSELELKRFERAAESFRRALALNRDYLRLPARFLLAESIFRQGDFAQAQAAYRQVLEQDRSSEYAREARYGLAWCAFRLAQYDQAIETIDEFRRRHPGDALLGELLFLRGESQLEAGRPREALIAYQQVAEGPYPPFLDAALRGAGFALAELEQHAAAAQAFESLIRRCPESRFLEEAGLQCGIQHLKAGNAEAAVQALSGQDGKPDAEWLYFRSRARKESGDPEGALADLDQALRQKPADDLAERCQIARGDLLFDLGRAEDAAAAYGRSNSDYALHAAAVASLNERRHDEARTLATRFLKQYPESTYRSKTHLVLGECELFAKRYRQAALHFEQAMQTESGPEPKEAKLRALSRLAWCRFLDGDMQQAAEGFAQVAKDGAPEDRPEALFMLGRSLESLGQTKEAVSAWRRYLSEYSGGADRAEVLVGLARLEPDRQGIARLEELLEQHGDHTAAPEALFSLAERQVRSGQPGQREQAMQRYRELLERFPEHELAGSAQYGLAWCLYEDEQFEPAALQLRALAARKSLEADLRLAGLELLVFAEQKAGDGSGAARAFESLQKVCRDEQRLLLAGRAAAEALSAAGRKPDADALWKRLGQSEDRGTLANTARIERAYLQLELGDLEEAVRQVQAVRAAARDVAASPELAEAAFYVAEALFESADYRRAAPLYELAAGAAGAELVDRAQYKLGFTLLRLEDLEGAARSFGALAADHSDSPLFGESLFLEGEMLYRLGRFAEAVSPLERLRREVPGHEVLPKALFRLGLARGQTEEWQAAEEALTELVRRSPQFENLAEAELWRGRALAARQNARSARQAFDRVIALDRGVLAARARIELGRLHYTAGEPEKALSEFLKVAVLYGSEAEVSESLYLAGLCLEKIGDHGRARGQYQELVQKYPRSVFAEPARERLEELKAF